MLVNLGLDLDLERIVRDIVRVETQLLWAEEQGMQVPAYALAAIREAAELHRERTAGAVLAA